MKEDHHMIKIFDKTRCCGCTACFNACPMEAITMTPDKEGFLYPEINLEKCVDCKVCEKVCPVLHKNKHEEDTKGYIVRDIDEKIVRDSTSGGAFTAFATYLLNEGYIVYGAGYDEKMNVVCKLAATPEELQEMRGSKFVQSTLGSTFQDIKNRLNRGHKVLFSGTPCQISGLICFLKDKPDNLFCIDFVCRGVPSPGLWRNYVSMMERKYKSRIIGAKFKNKTYGYHATTMKVDFENGKTWYGSGRVDPMMKAFVRELASRPSCSACAFKGITRQSDITMFDCYEFSSITGLKDDNKGYTSLFIHTKKGNEIFNKIIKNLIVYPIDVNKLVTKNGIMVNHSAKPNPKREEFYELASQLPIDVAMNMVDPITKKDYWIENAKGILTRLKLISLLKKIKGERVRVVKEE